MIQDQANQHQKATSLIWNWATPHKNPGSVSQCLNCTNGGLALPTVENGHFLALSLSLSLNKINQHIYANQNINW